VTAFDSGNSGTDLGKLNIKELNLLAKSSKYKRFVAKTRNDDVEEFLVRHGKLVKI
jgi:hypothetical protein